jgi:FdhD protein
VIQGSREVRADNVAFGSAKVTQGFRAVPVEIPVEITYGTIPYAVMMATPGDIEDFVVGFSLTEGVIQNAADVRLITVESHPKGLRAIVSLAPERLSHHLSRQRAITGRTGCGVCGIDDINALPSAKGQVVQGAVIAHEAINRAVQALSNHQPLNDITRAVHAAAWCDVTGAVLLSREDVGRHNALDKLIGALLREHKSPQSGFILITSRCSYEMIEKTAAFGASTMVAISAPTSLAIERAEALGITLYAIARPDGATQVSGFMPPFMLEKCA